ncbi:hypothetical protein B6V01_000950 [Methanosarcinales archaeon ex4572_44]|nr:MAG: hypothetical protein B6U67_04105 [Methanosarcinales archaeon ex4484_138]PHP46066.1 MAG: hypothetical protein B6V01_000950 [Methanosarcinales archaeon ex4572_44]RLG27012.1 MAG: hypothetical protein DRN85_01295 [Methanosarcinales archaeon]RLG27769.1 MAG: hypothetical protein DRN70_01640 [Methanosarcinales archaeon]HHI30720.1 DUF2111 domain-containing protein [Candidatus Methanoperedenaceae archaeon]
MVSLQISKDSSARELEPVAMAVYSLIGLPVAVRSLNKKGVHVINGKVVDYEFTGPVLEEVLSSGCDVKTVPTSGLYKGVPVSAVPLFDYTGELVGAIGVVADMIITELGEEFNLLDLFKGHPDIVHHVKECLKKILNDRASL